MILEKVAKVEEEEECTSGNWRGKHNSVAWRRRRPTLAVERETLAAQDCPTISGQGVTSTMPLLSAL